MKDDLLARVLQTCVLSMLVLYFCKSIKAILQKLHHMTLYKKCGRITSSIYNLLRFWNVTSLVCHQNRTIWRHFSIIWSSRKIFPLGA